MKLLSGYLWGYKNYKASDVVFRKFREFYPDGDLFCKVDKGGDVENYKKVCDNWNVSLSINPFRIGYCGNFGSVNVNRTHWPKESIIQWLDGLYDACSNTSSKYMIVLEEDVFILNPISVLNIDFSLAILPQNNGFPAKYRDYLKQHNGNSISQGYGAGGGVIINREGFLNSWNKYKSQFHTDFEELESISHLIGWNDFALQFVMMLGNHQVIVNDKLAEPWRIKNWEKFDIVHQLKDYEIIKTL